MPVSYVQLLLFRNYCSDLQGNKDWATLCIHKSHGEIIGEVKVVNEPIVGGSSGLNGLAAEVT